MGKKSEAALKVQRLMEKMKRDLAKVDKALAEVSVAMAEVKATRQVLCAELCNAVREHGKEVGLEPDVIAAIVAPKDED